MSHQHQPVVDIEATLAQMQGGPAHDIAPVRVEPVPDAGRLGGMVRTALETRPGKAVVGSLTTLMAVAALGACSKAPEATAANPTVGISSTESAGASTSAATDPSSETSSSTGTTASGETTTASGSDSESTTGIGSASSSESSDGSSEQNGDKIYGGVPLADYEAETASKSEMAALVQQYPELQNFLDNQDAIMSKAAALADSKSFLKAYQDEQSLEKRLWDERADVMTLPTMPNILDAPVDGPYLADSIEFYHNGTLDQINTSIALGEKGDVELIAKIEALRNLDPETRNLNEKATTAEYQHAREYETQNGGKHQRAHVTAPCEVTLLDGRVILPSGQALQPVVFDYTYDNGTKYVVAAVVAPMEVPTAFGEDIAPSVNPDTAFPVASGYTVLLNTAGHL